jgi:hypothetical protein
MRAWRRAQRGEDLSEPAEEQLDWLPSDLAAVRVPENGEAFRSGGSGSSTAEPVPTAAGVARAAEGGDYAPFHEGAIRPPAEAPAKERPAPTVEQTVRRITTAIERCLAAMDGSFQRQFPQVAEKDRRRFLNAVEQLAEKAAGLE